VRKRFEPIRQPRIVFSRSTRHADRLADRRRQPDCLEGVVDAARRHLDDARHGVPLRGVHPIGRAEAGRELELPGCGVDGDDAPGARDAAALNDREPDAAAADPGDAPPRAHPRRVEDGAETGRDAAADQRHPVERDVGTDPYQRGLAVLRKPGRRSSVRRMVASPSQRFGRPATQYSHVPQKTERQPITWSPGATCRTSLPHVLDDARLVPEDGRERVRERSLEDVEVAVADARGGGADDHLARPRRVDLYLLDAEGLADRAHHGSLHPDPQVCGSDSSPRRKIIGFQRGAPGASARSGSRQQPAQAVVVGRVPEHEPVSQHLGDRPHRRALARVALVDLAEAIGGERRGAVEDLDDVLVARDPPRVEGLAPVDWVVVPEPGVEGERILDVSPGLEVEVRPAARLPHRRASSPSRDRPSNVRHSLGGRLHFAAIT